MKNLKGSKTAENLMKAFAGECQARTRYTFYSGVAKSECYIQISNIFMEIAEQEREHAKRFYKLLTNEIQDEAIEIQAMYPAAYHKETLKNLKAAAAGENEEWSDIYQSFRKIAEDEGFLIIAKAFKEIAEVEESHEKRFNKLAKNIEDGTVFRKDEKVLWKCNNCGYIHEGKEAPKVCPACLHPQGYFEVFCENY
ncbi:MAG: rubrerythrin family protein [Clostridium sp.]